VGIAYLVWKNFSLVYGPDLANEPKIQRRFGADPSIGPRPGENLMRKFLTFTAIFLVASQIASAQIGGTNAVVRHDNALIVDIEVNASHNVSRLQVTYESPGIERLASKWIPADRNGPTRITVGRLRASKLYTYTVRGIDRFGAPAGAASGNFSTGALPAALAANTYKLEGRISSSVVVFATLETNFKGYIGMDLHSPDAPQIVWYYSNAPSGASGAMQVDQINSIIQDSHGNFIFADTGSGPPPLAADAFYRKITPDGTILSESPVVCQLNRPAGPVGPGWIWAYGNDSLEQLLPGIDGNRETVVHLVQIVKDPFADSGLASPGARLQTGIGIARWTPGTGKDELLWDPFNFLNPLTDRTDTGSSDPGANSSTASPVPCAGASVQAEEWMHSNSLQFTPTGEFLMSVRMLDTIVAISPRFDRISWRLGRFGSDFSFPEPEDRFYHEHFVRMLENGNILMLDNGNGRPASEGGLYSRALELALDWNTMTASKVWEYRHVIGDNGGSPVYKYADKVGIAQRLENGNTLVLFGADIDPNTLAAKSPQTFTLVEADHAASANVLAVLDIQMPGGNQIYRALPVDSLFGETAGR
jgi:hypothetical protein